MNIKPLSNRVVLKNLEAEETTKGGIILTSAAKEKPEIAEVIAVGEGEKNDKGEIIPMTVKIGDKVIVTNGILAEHLKNVHGTIIEEYVPNSHFEMLAGSQRWIVRFEGLGDAIFRESDLQLMD